MPGVVIERATSSHDAAPRIGGRRRLPLFVLAAAGVVAGPLLIASGLNGGTPQAAPLPSATFQVSAPAVPVPADESIRLAPLTVSIPQLDAEASIEDRPVTGGGDLVIPGDPAVVGRWDGGAALDSHRGTTLLAGHVDINGDLGALHELASIEAGAEVHTSDARGHVTRWVVTGLDVRHKDDLPTFAPDGPRRLVLVTCGGPVLRSGNGWTYRDNVIVTATPLDAPDAQRT
ncbi:MAG: class F sortase [Dermatophilus congolensis]|nr:class F sortase [Dermatophilus congolensis]